MNHVDTDTVGQDVDVVGARGWVREGWASGFHKTISRGHIAFWQALWHGSWIFWEIPPLAETNTMHFARTVSSIAEYVLLVQPRPLHKVASIPRTFKNSDD